MVGVDLWTYIIAFKEWKLQFLLEASPHGALPRARGTRDNPDMLGALAGGFGFLPHGGGGSVLVQSRLLDDVLNHAVHRRLGWPFPCGQHCVEKTDAEGADGKFKWFSNGKVWVWMTLE